MSMTFRQLEVFVEAARDLNFSKTADRLGISQAAVSNQIRVLERWAGRELCERSRGSTPRLSAEGTTLLSQAQTLIAGKRQLPTRQDRRPRKERLRLRIAAGAYLLERYIRPALPRFLQKHDGVVLDFLPTGAGVKDMQRAVRSGNADVAVFNGRRSVRRFAGAELIGETPCALYGTARFARLAAKGADIASLPFVLPLEGSAMEQWALGTLKKAGITPQNVVARSQFMDVIADTVLSGMGVSVAFDEHMARHASAGRVSRLGPQLESCSCVLPVGKRARNRAAAPFLEFLRQLLSRRASVTRPTR
jgi:DNA-binding transcriptional LysR family regulator